MPLAESRSRSRARAEAASSLGQSTIIILKLNMYMTEFQHETRESTIPVGSLIFRVGTGTVAKGILHGGRRRTRAASR